MTCEISRAGSKVLASHCTVPPATPVSTCLHFQHFYNFSPLNLSDTVLSSPSSSSEDILLECCHMIQLPKEHCFGRSFTV